LRDE